MPTRSMEYATCFRVGEHTCVYESNLVRFIQTANSFDSDVHVLKNDKKVNGKSLLGVLSLEITGNDLITISAKGEDCAKAVRELVKLLKNFEEMAALRK